LCDENCRIPRCLAVATQGDEVLIALEDLDQAEFPVRKNAVSITELTRCLSWLAHFHASFMHRPPEGLWRQGTYWHLATRPDELKALTDKPLAQAAAAIDRKLRNSPLQTLVHGDAKLANFCFSKDGKNIAAVDFQYVGGGCGMQDVAYFIGSCLDENDSQRLDSYFRYLAQALKTKQKAANADAIE
jgi:Ser/Thr protein kinase RdoA (MazF antagonist)